MPNNQQASDLIARLSASPARIAQATVGWSEAQLRAARAGDDWSASAILAHLRAADDILAYRAYMILVRDSAPMPSFDERRWAEVAGYTEADFHTSLEVFRLRRAELVAMLRRARPDDWRRSGVHEERGVVALIDIITHVVEHEAEHCAQIEALRPKSSLQE